jgi:hypothetical protein
MELHKKYGDVVRVSPNEISFISGETAWQDIYGFRVGQLKGQLNMQKDPVWYPAPINGTPSILVSGDEAHSRGRRVLSHAFSEKALAEQEPLLTRFVDLLVDGLKDTTANNEGPQDMTDWYVSCDPSLQFNTSRTDNDRTGRPSISSPIFFSGSHWVVFKTASPINTSGSFSRCSRAFLSYTPLPICPG